VPGLYEQLFAERLDCDSPRVVTDLLAEQLRSSRIDAGRLTALDFGAGNGMVGELLDGHGVGAIVGVDLLAAARDAAHRDRPGVYEDYYALDLTRLHPVDRHQLARHRVDLMTCVAALGFGDIPPLAFAEAFNLVASPGWIAFNLRDRYVNSACFGRFIARMFDEGILVERARTRYTHRVSVAGEPLEYDAIVAEKRADVPLEWARAAGG
jgi:predicted TPR repeat methyltransferase